MEIVTRGEVRREYTSEERAQVLTEAAMPGARVLLVAQRYGISPSLVYRWRREAAGRPARQARQARPRAPSFVPLLVDSGGPSNPSALQAVAPAQDSRAERIEVVLRNGRLLRVAGTADPGVIARLAAALET
ncbi:MAG TPA: transposase [Pseudoxanthomonas sp.]|nr:transposase [Pseudoxanthomonas sp.]